MRRRIVAALSAIALIFTCSDIELALGAGPVAFGAGGSSTEPNVSLVKSVNFTDSEDMWSRAFSPDRSRLAVSSPNSTTVHVWDVKGSPRIVLKLDMPGGGSVNGLRFSDDGRFLAAANGGGPDSHLFRIWKASTGSLFRDVADPYSDGGPLITVGFDFLGAGGQMARVQTNPPIGRPPASSGESLRVADTITQVTAWESTLSDRADKLWRNRASNRVAVAEWKRVVQEGRPRIQPKILIVDAIERKGIANFDVLDFGCSVTYASWSDDGSRLALGGTIVGDEARRLTGPTVQIWDAATQTLLNEFSYKKGFHLLGLLGAPQDKFMVVAWDDAVEIRSGDGSAVEQTIRAKPSAIALSADGQQLAIAETDRRISVWNVKKRRH